MVSRRNRLLLSSDISMTPTYGNRTGVPHNEDASLDSNMVIILAALLFALLCALGLNSIVRCFLSRSHHHGADSSGGRQIPVAVYKEMLGTDCPICLVEFVQGEYVGTFPKCNHGFHVKCISRWLVSHSSCPTCRQPLMISDDHVRAIEIT